MLWDLRHPLAEPGPGEAYPLTWAELAIVDLSDEIQQELDDKLEMLDPSTGDPSTDEDTAVFGVRLRYCLQYEPADESLEHWVEYSKSGLRVPRNHRELLGAIIIERTPPLQLRVEGAFRALAMSQDAPRINSTIESFAEDVRAATHTLAESEAVRSAVDAMTKSGASRALQVEKDALVEGVGFAAEDGSISGLLRALQPTLDLDAGGALPLTSHGSTAASVLGVTEALAASRMDHRIVIIDDFGDTLDSAAADFLARVMSRPRNQIWLSTRRPEALGAFEPEEILRLTRHSGQQVAHRLLPTLDRQERTTRRYLPQILSGAMSSRTLVLVEGPHDIEGYSAVDRKQLSDSGLVPLSGRSVQLVAASATGGDGGKSRLATMARLATSLGFEVRAIVDSDKPGEDDDLIAELEAVCSQVVLLPTRTAVERALVKGLKSEPLRQALRALNDDYGLRLDVDALGDSDLESALVKALKQKGGLHKAYVAALPPGAIPPIVEDVLKSLRAEPGTIVRTEIDNP